MKTNNVIRWITIPLLILILILLIPIHYKSVKLIKQMDNEPKTYDFCVRTVCMPLTKDEFILVTKCSLGCDNFKSELNKLGIKIDDDLDLIYHRCMARCLELAPSVVEVHIGDE